MKQAAGVIWRSALGPSRMSVSPCAFFLATTRCTMRHTAKQCSMSPAIRNRFSPMVDWSQSTTMDESTTMGLSVCFRLLSLVWFGVITSHRVCLVGLFLAPSLSRVVVVGAKTRFATDTERETDRQEGLSGMPFTNITSWILLLEK